MRLLIETAADYYDSHPAAGILLLQGAFSHASHAAHTAKNVRLGDDVRRALAAMRPPLILPESPDAATLAVEIAFACMAHGYAREGRISPGARSEALRAASSYLATWGVKASPRPVGGVERPLQTGSMRKRWSAAALRPVGQGSARIGQGRAPYGFQHKGIAHDQHYVARQHQRDACLPTANCALPRNPCFLLLRRCDESRTVPDGGRRFQ